MPCLPVTLFLLLAISLGLAPTADAATISAPELWELYSGLNQIDVDTRHARPASGEVLERPSMRARFLNGSFHAVVRGEDRRVGFVFVGEGELAITPPPDEAEHLARYTGRESLTASFDRAFVMATDGSLLELFGDEEWMAEGKPVAALHLFEGRRNLLADDRWTHLVPDLALDSLQDLHGQGPLGGHLFAEFRVAEVGRTEHTNEGRSRWVSYYRNPRGALFPQEETAIFSHWRSGDSSQEIEVWVSQPDEGHIARTYPYDITRVELDVNIPPADGRNLERVEVDERVSLVNTQPFAGIS